MKKQQPKHSAGRRFAGLLALALFLGVTASLPAQTVSRWIGTYNGAAWSNPTNWNNATVPNGVDAVATFGTNYLVSGTNTSIIYDPATTNGGVFTFGTITCSNSMTIGMDNNNNPFTDALTGAVTSVTGPAPIFNILNNATVYQYFSLAGSQGFTKLGNGNLTKRYVTYTEPFTGPVTIGQGTLTMNIDANFGNVTNPIVMTNGAALTCQPTSGPYNNGTPLWLSAGRNLTLAGGGAVTINVAVATNTLVIPGVIQNSAGTNTGLTLSGPGSLVLSNANTFAGALTVTGTGTNVLDNQNALQNSTLTLNAAGPIQFGSAVSGNAFTVGGLAGTSVAANLALQNNAGTPAAIALTVGGNTTNTTFAGIVSGPGSLTKTGTGSLTLAGTNTFTGAVTVQQGRLAVSTLSSGRGSYAVSDGATNQVLLTAAGQTLTNSSLTLGVSTGGVQEFNATNFSVTATMLRVTNLTLNGTATVNVYGTTFVIGTYNLLAYSSKTGTGTWSLGTLPAGLGATLNDTGSILQLIVTSTAGSPNIGFLWRGEVGGIWATNDLVNTNWYGLQSATLTYYTETNGAATVTFDDSATGTKSVVLNQLVKPGSVILSNNTSAYTLTGTGGIGGTATVTKNGTGTYTVGTTNTYSGATTINAGTLALAGANNLLPATGSVTFNNNGSSLNLGGGSQTLAGLNFASISNASWTSVVTGGSLTLSGAANFVGSSGLTSTMDLSGLSNFNFTNTASGFNLGSSLASSNGTVVVKLAGGTNFIATSALNLAQTAGAGTSPGPVNLLYLGQSNTIWTATIQMGGYRDQTNLMAFQSGLTSPTVTLAGPGGASRISNIFLSVDQSGSIEDSGILDASQGTISCLVSNLTMSEFNSAAEAYSLVNVSGAASVVDILNLNLVVKDATGGAGGSGVAAFKQNGGLVKAQTITFANTGGTTNALASVLQAGYYLNGGTLSAQTIQPGLDDANTNGLASFRTLFWTNGIIQDYSTSAPLTVVSGGNPAMAIAVTGNGSRAFVVDAGITNTIECSINQANAANTPVVMNGPGTLDLQGSTSNALFSLNVSNGIVLLDKTGAEAIGAGNGLTLNGGTVVLAGNGGTGNNQINDTAPLTLNSGHFNLNGQTETIGGLAGSGGTLQDTNVAPGNLTVNLSGTTNTFAGAIAGGYLTFTNNGLQIFTGTDTRSLESTTVGDGSTATVLQIGSGAAVGTLAGGYVQVNANSSLAFDSTGTENFAGAINGSGNVVQAGSGTLVLSGSDSHTGETLVNAGTLALPSGGVSIGGSVITVASGTTFNVTAGAGGFTVGYGQTLNGSGSVTGNYSVGYGGTNSGNLTVNGSLTVQSGGTLNPGTAITAGTIAVNGSFTNAGTLLYHLGTTTSPGGGTNALLTVTGNLDLGNYGTTTLAISGTPVGGTYVIATFGTFSGSVASITVTAGGSTRYTFTPQISGHQLQLVVAGNAANLVWSGDGVNNNWDANNSGNPDWFNTGTSLADFFNNGDNALFNDTSTNLTVNVNSTVLPSTLTFNAAGNYTLQGSADISGPITLVKTNTGTLTINNYNTFTGPVDLNGGVVSVSAVSPLGTPQPLGEGGVLAFNGGTFQYTGGSLSAGSYGGLVTLGANGGVFDMEGGAFVLTNPVTGGGAFTKAGPGVLVLGDVTSGTGSNSFSGVTYVTNGQVQLENAAALGSTAGATVVTEPGSVAAANGFAGTISEPLSLSGVGDGNGALQALGGSFGTAVNYAGSISLPTNAAVGSADGTGFTIGGIISGTGTLTFLSPVTNILLGANTYSGGSFITAGSTVQLGTNGTGGALPATGIVTNNGVIQFNRADTNAVLATIKGTGSVVADGGGVTILGAANAYTAGTTIFGTANPTNGWAGALQLTNSLGAGTGHISVNGGASYGALQLAGNVTIANAVTLYQKNSVNSGAGAQPPCISNMGGTNTVNGLIALVYGGNYWAFNSDAGQLNLANATNNIGSFGRPIYLEGAGSGSISNVFDGTQYYLQMNKYGAGTWTITGSAAFPAGINVYQGLLAINGFVNKGTNAGNTVVQGGANLLVNGTLPGTVNVSSNALLAGSGIITNAVTIQGGGLLAPGWYAGTNTAALTLNGNLTIKGNLAFNLNTLLVRSNDFVAVGGTLTNGGTGTLTVTNFGSALTAGETFYLFSKPVLNGGALTIAGGGADVVWTNSLSADGSITVLSVTPPVSTTPFAITNVLTGGTLQLSWPADHVGWRLLEQTNNVAAGVSSAPADWGVVAGSAVTNLVNITVDPTQPGAYYRMVYP